MEAVPFYRRQQLFFQDLSTDLFRKWNIWYFLTRKDLGIEQYLGINVFQSIHVTFPAEIVFQNVFFWFFSMPVFKNFSKWNCFCLNWASLSENRENIFSSLFVFNVILTYILVLHNFRNGNIFVISGFPKWFWTILFLPLTEEDCRQCGDRGRRCSEQRHLSLTMLRALARTSQLTFWLGFC